MYFFVIMFVFLCNLGCDDARFEILIYIIWYALCVCFFEKPSW